MGMFLLFISAFSIRALICNTRGKRLWFIFCCVENKVKVYSHCLLFLHLKGLHLWFCSCYKVLEIKWFIECMLCWWEISLRWYPKWRWACEDTLREGFDCCYYLLKCYMTCMFGFENVWHPIFVLMNALIFEYLRAGKTRCYKMHLLFLKIRCNFTEMHLRIRIVLQLRSRP